jgi:hypothetical protein
MRRGVVVVRLWHTTVGKPAYTLEADLAIMSLTAIRNRPPVSTHRFQDGSDHAAAKRGRPLLPRTICIYSSSVGHVKESRQKRSSPWPRCRLINSSVGSEAI